MKTIFFMLAFVLTTGAAFAQENDILYSWNEDQNLTTASHLPPAIYTSINKLYPDYSVLSVYKSPTMTVNGVLNYIVEIQKGRECLEVEFAPDGKQLVAVKKQNSSKDMNERANK